MKKQFSVTGFQLPVLRRWFWKPKTGNWKLTMTPEEQQQRRRRTVILALVHVALVLAIFGGYMYLKGSGG